MNFDAIQPLALTDITRRIGGAIAATQGLSGVWVVAETSDLRVAGGHCYMELIQKDDAGRPLAKVRAVIWASTYARLGVAFAAATGSRLASDMKVMVRADVSYHAVYGLSLVINDINPDYTAGDLVRRRNAILARLQADGVLDLNKTLPFPATPQRVAVISARGAAGYGDFVRHLYGNSMSFRFTVELFEAVMQGDKAPASVISALDRINERIADFDIVVIIRGGGAVSELACFDDYELAFNIAQFPLPVIVGIGHQRDITVLDFVAARSVKTPTAAAELLIGAMAAALDRLISLGNAIANAVAEKVAGQKEQLAYWTGSLPALVRAIVARQHARIDAEFSRGLRRDIENILHRRADRLDALADMLALLGTEATLRRGYSITRVDGHAVTDATALAPGAVLTTTFAHGEVKSTVKP